MGTMNPGNYKGQENWLEKLEKEKQRKGKNYKLQNTRTGFGMNNHCKICIEIIPFHTPHFSITVFYQKGTVKSIGHTFLVFLLWFSP